MRLMMYYSTLQATADDVKWLVAKLFKRGDVSFSVNGVGVSMMNKNVEEIINFIAKKAFVEKLMLEERVRVADKDKKIVRNVLKELFHTSSQSENEFLSIFCK